MLCIELHTVTVYNKLCLCIFSESSNIASKNIFQIKSYFMISLRVKAEFSPYAFVYILTTILVIYCC